MPLARKGGHKLPYTRDPKTDAKNPGSVNATPEGGSKPHGHTRIPGGSQGHGNSRPGPH